MNTHNYFMKYGYKYFFFIKKNQLFDKDKIQLNNKIKINKKINLPHFDDKHYNLYIWIHNKLHKNK